MSDLISKQAAIKNAHFPMIDDAGYEIVRVDDILALPSAESKTGEWTNAGVLTVRCSNCKSEFHELEAMNYCPNCGARMNGGEEE